MKEKFRNFIIELKTFGIIEVFWHIFISNDYCKLKMMRKRQKKIQKFSLSKRKEIVEREYEKCTGKKINLDNPITFNEKIQWLKVYDSTMEKSNLSDKYLSKKIVGEKIGANYIIPLIGAWEKAKDIDFNALPDRYCIKLNHGSGMNIVVKNNKSADHERIREQLKKWSKTPFGIQNCYELHYLNIKPIIIAEEYIEQEDGNLLDYKIHCFDGKPKIIQVIGDRDEKLDNGKEAVFDLNWNRIKFDSYSIVDYEEKIEQPDCLDKMIEIAEKLSKDFKYVRVDLFLIGNKIFFGEMTFTPTSGLDKWGESVELGKLISI